MGSRKNWSCQEWCQYWKRKTEENIKTEQYFNKEEYLHKTIKRVSFAKQENKVRQDHHEDTEKNAIRALKKLDTPYNPASLNYIHDKFKYTTLEYTSQEK